MSNYINNLGQTRLGWRVPTVQQLQTATYLLDSYSGAAAAYSLRKLKNSSTSSIRVRRGLDNQETDIGFDANGDLDTTSLLSFTNISNTSKILDTYTASAAYSLRKLSTSYSGSAIRVRRSGDNLEQNIGFDGSGNLDTTGLLSFVNSSDTSTSKLLDQYSGAIAAYSLRKLSASYSGSAIRVRRSSDNQEMNIGFDAGGNLDTVSLISFVGSANGFVTTWYDQSGNSSNLVQITSTLQMRIVGNGVIETINGKPALVNNYNYAYKGEYKATYATPITSPVTMFNIGSNTQVPGVGYLWDGLNSNMYVYSYWTDWMRIGGSAEFALQGYLQNISKQRIINAIYNGSSSLLSINGTFSVTGNVGTATSTGLTLGSSGYGAPAFYQEHIVYASNKNSQLSVINSNINSYYSIYTPTGSGFVTTWYDQSGNGRNVSQSSSSAQPRIVNNGVIDLINNKPSLKFTNGQVLISSQNVLSTGSQPYSIYGVSYNNTDSNSTLFYIGTTSLNYYNGNQFISLQVNSGGNTTQFRHFWGSSSDWYSNINTNNSQLFYSIEYSGSARYSSKNDNSVSTNNVSKNTVSPILHIGVLPSVNEYYKGYHQELILFDNYNSSTTTNIIKLNINTYYNIWSNPSYWSAFVTTWYDQSGFNKHTTQPTLSSQPTIVSNGNVITTNGKPSIYFDGANNLLQTSTAVLSTGNKSYSIYGVSYTLATSQSTLFFVGTFNPNNGIGLAVYNNVSRHYWPYNDFDSSSLFNFYQTYYSIEFDGTRRYTTVNNSLQNSLSSNKNTTNPILTIGRLSSIQSYYGYHQELILWDDYNSASASNAISTSVNNYYSIWGGIVTNGLVLNLDASKYYNTTWTDISGYGNNGTLTNGVGYSSTNGGVMTFDGVNDYVLVNNNTSLNLTNISVSVWVKPINTNYSPIIFRYWSITANNGWHLFYSGSKFYAGGRESGTQYLTLSSNNTYSINNWYNLTWTKSGSTWSLYINGVFDNSSNLGLGNVIFTNNNLTIGSENTSAFANTNIGNVNIYNRALSASEIQQNFNALKSRFGL